MKNKIKIGIVCYPTYGGSGVVATELGVALSKKKYEVHFISYDQPFRLDLFSEKIYYHEVSVPQYPLFEYAPYELNLTSKLVDVAINEGLDLLHVHYAIPHASAAVNAKQILSSQGVNIPIVTTLHGTDITLLGKDASFKPVIEYAINMSDIVTVVSQDLKNETLAHFNIKKEINVISNFIDYSLYNQNQNLKLRDSFASRHESIITHISNFREVKRVEDVIKIFYEVNKRKEVQLLMIGDGPDRSKCENLARKLDIHKKIKFLGKLKVIEDLLAISDIFLLPSQTESFGLVALEAMASNTAVVSSNSGGIPEVNIDGITGFLSDVGDINKMSNDICELISNSNLLNTFKLNALNHAKKFDLNNILPKYEEVYTKLIKNYD
jgi:N-acetyl-alpha-D-glucosaminyl L-malate synthase BshA